MLRVILLAACVSGAIAAETKQTNSPSIYHLGRCLSVYVYVFDKWRAFIFDTGADYTILDQPLTNHLGRVVSESVVNTGDGISPPLQFFNGNSLYLAGHWTKLPYLGAFDISIIRQLAGEPIEGFVGIDLLTNYAVSLDFSVPSLALSTNLPFPLRTGIPLETNLNSFTFPAKLASNKTLNIGIDTGYSGAIHLNPADWQTAFPNGPAVFKPASSSDFTGTISTGMMARLPTLKIGPYTYTNLLCDRISNTNVPSHVGLEFLRQHRLIINYPDRLLNIQRIRPQNPIDHDLSGLGLKWPDPRGLPVVFTIAPESPASNTGLEEGDEILKIQGKDPRQLGKLQIHRLLRAGENQVVVIEAQRNGNPINAKIVLKRRL